MHSLARDVPKLFDCSRIYINKIAITVLFVFCPPPLIPTLFEKKLTFKSVFFKSYANNAKVKKHKISKRTIFFLHRNKRSTIWYADDGWLNITYRIVSKQSSNGSILNRPSWIMGGGRGLGCRCGEVLMLRRHLPLYPSGYRRRLCSRTCPFPRGPLSTSV